VARDQHGAIDAVWRIESPRLIAGLARMLGDVGAAEDAAQDALVRALETWPRDGVPENPGAWLMAVGKRIAIDRIRRAQTFARKQDEVEWMIGSELATSAPPDAVGDDLLSLMFTCCHPVLSAQARATLTLRLLGGLRTDEIARAYLTSEATVAQRVSRAKRTLADARVGFAPPSADDVSARLASVLEVIYLIFNEGHTATSGDDWLRADLCFDALRLGRTLAELAPHEPEPHALVALMSLQASRLRARTTPSGDPILLPDQDRSRWDRTLIAAGLRALRRAERCDRPGGPYLAQAAIAASHAEAGTAEATDWLRIAALYEVLAQLTPSPVIELNRAVAVSYAFGPAPALALLDTITLPSSHLLPAVRADLLLRLDRPTEAHAELLRAASLTRNTRERDPLLARAARLAG
jgi:RNA polymerase sigma factor (sigma-70 family)